MTNEADPEEIPTPRRVAWALLALLAAWAAFRGAGPLVLLVPGSLLRAQRGLSGGKRAGLLALWGALFSAVFYRWAFYYGWLPWLGLVTVRGLPWMVFGVPLMIQERRYGRRGEVPACGVGYAAVTQLLLLGPTGADWDTPASTLADWPWMLSTLPWVGLAGTAFLLGVVSGGLFRGRKSSAALAGVVLLLWLGLSWVLFARNSPNMPELSVALLQTGWEQGVKWDKDNVRAAEERLFELTRKAAGARLIVWPETAWPRRGMRRHPSDTRRIGKLAREMEAQLLVTSIEELPDGWHNSVSQVLPRGAFGSEYVKRRLAPFAEYIPLPTSWQFTLREMEPFKHISPYLAGEEQVIMECEGYRFGLLVCYESMTPQAVAGVARECDFLVVVTNDAPFRSEYPKELHFHSAVLRAIQFQKPVFQASNNGVTGFVDARGVVRGRFEPGFSGPGVKLFEPPGMFSKTQR